MDQFVINRRRGQRSVRLRLDNQGKIIISGPLSLRDTQAKELLVKHSAWIENAKSKLAQKKQIICADPLPMLRAKTQSIVRERLLHFNQFYNFSYRTIRLSSAKTRWGSCGSLGNLTFNCKLSVLPQHLIDYVVVHELCHLKEHNHSKSFWNLVSVHVPDHKARRRELRNLVIN